MDFFDKLSQKVSEGYNAAAEKTKEVAREAKLKMTISDCKNKIDEEYKKIGKSIYETFLTKREDDVAMGLIQEFKTIDELNETIKNSEAEISGIKDKTVKTETQVFEGEVIDTNNNANNGENNDNNN
ncbi:MAG: hypothetical protein IKP28_04830 [Clostridia bacterium]|nr:hypothetical protein [Clostridia bacterium]